MPYVIQARKSKNIDMSPKKQMELQAYVNTNGQKIKVVSGNDSSDKLRVKWNIIITT